MLSPFSSLGHLLRSPGFRRYFQNTSWLIGEKLVRLFIGLSVGVYVARYLGPERFGLLSFALSFVSLFGFIGNLGLDSIVIRETVRDPRNNDNLFGTAFGLKSAGSLIVLVCIYLITLLLNLSPNTQIIILVIACSHLFSAFQIIDDFYQSIVAVKYSVISKLVGIFIFSSIRLILIWKQAELIWFAWAGVLEIG
ncbi:MAG: oligosaccharide flippase family protein, partial [Fidelibacterota bacterium]